MCEETHTWVYCMYEGSVLDSNKLRFFKYKLIKKGTPPIFRYCLKKRFQTVSLLKDIHFVAFVFT